MHYALRSDVSSGTKIIGFLVPLDKIGYAEYFL